MEDLEAILLFETRHGQVNDLLGGLISLRSAYWAEQYHAKVPDEAEIKRLEEEMLFFSALRSRALLMSIEEITLVIEQYRPQFKEEDRIRREYEAARGGT
ncbi:hypothetical protein ACO0LF_14765 [Undibacterium sp. Di27W]|uniref:hypothetical protein n=1 Tax=Undibacterium sp. Di27W TaxID=3413036 RepID=UPI003BF28F91